MRKLLILAVSALAGGMLSAVAPAAVTMAPLTTFGNNGWIDPATSGYSYLDTANNERGIAYGNGHLYLVSRVGGNFVRILDPTTGADLGALNTTGITGGTFAVNAIGTGTDGAIYVGNLTTNSSSSPFKIYKWANEASTPTVAFSGATLSGARVGDDLAATGGGSSTLLAAGFGSSPSVTGNNSYAIIDPTAGSSTTVAFPGTPPNAGDFRLGITFSDASHVLGSAGSTLYRYTSFSGSTGTLIGTGALTTSAERLLSYQVVDGMPLLAVQSTGDSTVRLYDATDPSNPVLLTSGNNTTGTLATNGNASGAIAWGPTIGDTATLYAMSTNQGIQAFTVTIPEPGSIGLVGLGLMLGLWRGRRREIAPH